MVKAMGRVSGSGESRVFFFILIVPTGIVLILLGVYAAGHGHLPRGIGEFIRWIMMLPRNLEILPASILAMPSCRRCRDDWRATAPEMAPE